MTREAFVIGTACTKFGKLPAMGFKALTKQVYLEVLNDAGLESGQAIEMTWFGNCGMGTFGQRNIRGQVCFTPLVRDGSFPERVPLINVEGGCATASMAFHGAWKDVAAGQSDLSLAVGVEKTFVPDSQERTREIFEGGIDQLDPEEWIQYYRSAGQRAGKSFDANTQQGTLFVETYAMQACFHMAKYGTTRRQIAASAAKNHGYGCLNHLAQYQFPVSIDAALADRVVSYPLTRAMCAPVSDGAAAALICSEAYLRTQPPSVQRRAIRIAASALSGGKYRDLDEPGLTRVAAERAYRAAGRGPEDIDLLEVHDATSFSEIYQVEMLGFCPDGRGGAFVEAGATALGGAIPTNLSGGLVAKGHPVGATGLSMIYELCLQLRGEAGSRQVQGARVAMAENGGGVIGFDEAACAITILEST